MQAHDRVISHCFTNSSFFLSNNLPEADRVSYDKYKYRLPTFPVNLLFSFSSSFLRLYPFLPSVRQHVINTFMLQSSTSDRHCLYIEWSVSLSALNHPQKYATFGTL